MKIENLSLRQLALGIFVFIFLDWAIAQFALVPYMTGDERKHLYAAGNSPYPWILGIVFVCFAMWFVFLYKGRLSNHKRKLYILGMGLGCLGGMLINLTIRLTWHI